MGCRGDSYGREAAAARDESLNNRKNFTGECHLKVQFFAYLRDPEFAGCREMTSPPAATLRELGDRLCDRFGNRFREELYSPDGQNLGERVIVMVNGRRVDFLAGLDTALKDTDTVLIFPVVAGG